MGLYRLQWRIKGRDFVIAHPATLALRRTKKHGTRINLISINSNSPSNQALPRNPFTSGYLCVLFHLIQRTQCNGLSLTPGSHMG